MKNSKIVGLLAVVALIVAAIAYLSMGKAGPRASSLPALDVVAAEPAAQEATSSTAAAPKAPVRDLAAKARQYEKAKELVAPSGFVNTGGKPITLSQYVGKKVILLDIMTYSCINCIRTFPYLVDWYKKYEDKGLVIIGIHTPEFDFEKDIDNVATAMEKYGIRFPVVLDNDYGTWSAYKNLYWPRKYLIDIDGYVVYDHIGEGGYAETEEKIQELLKERADVLGAKVQVEMPISAGETEQGTPGQSPETYFGSARAVPGAFKLNGIWATYADHVENTSLPASIEYKFASKKVFFVASADAPVKVDVVIDGKPQDTIEVSEARLYDVYAGAAFGVHSLELRPQSKGLKAFTLTFGN